MLKHCSARMLVNRIGWNTGLVSHENSDVVTSFLKRIENFEGPFSYLLHRVGSLTFLITLWSVFLPLRYRYRYRPVRYRTAWGALWGLGLLVGSVSYYLVLWSWLAHAQSRGCDIQMFLATVTNRVSALLMHSQKSSHEERARVLVCLFSVAPHQVL